MQYFDNNPYDTVSKYMITVNKPAGIKVPQMPQKFQNPNRFERRNDFRGYNKHDKKKKNSGKLETILTIEEGEVLLRNWKENNFGDFNTWIQIAKANVSYECIDTTSELNPSNKSFTCNLKLNFEEDLNNVLISNGFGKNKKDAKKMAIEKIVIELIQNGQIRFGLKDKAFLAKKQDYQTDQFGNILHNDAKQNINITGRETIKAKCHKLSKKLQESLKYDKFAEACAILCQILMQKPPDWNEVIIIIFTKF